jgi:lysophospholipase L1-like esterase
MSLKFINFTIALFAFYVVAAQPFATDIAAFKKQDSISFPAFNQILFVGSSSFTNWTDVQSYFPGYKILNRGFGGSSLKDVSYYAEKIIYPYQPKQIIIYCGENDIAGDTLVTGEIVFERFKILYNQIRTQLPNIPIAYICMKPSPSRWHLKQKMMQGNRLIEKFLKKKKRNGKFVNVWPAMLNGNGEPMQSIFVKDMLHMNADGYKIW